MRAFPVAAAAAALCLLAGCAQAPVGSTPTTSTGLGPSPSAVASASASAVARLSEEQITLTQGQPADLSGTRGLPKTIVRIDSITEQADCATGATTPSRGQFVAVKVTGFRQGKSGQFDLAVYDWLAVDGAGAEYDAKAAVTTGLCVPEEERLSLDYDSAGQVHGTILLDAPSALARLLIRNTLADPPVTVVIELPPRA
ncbi:MAG: hypothetical protein LBI84_01525 [Propionibacteriaceae bacterium]|jgi:hypothetical protein|nr:hypothetical protein [Propionibacteriaceae bacterium]